MKKIKSILLIMMSLLLLAFAFIFVQSRLAPECSAPIILGASRNHTQPEKIVQNTISDLGGLPKTDMDIWEAQNILESGGVLPIYAVDDWRIEQSSANNGRFTIFDDDPTYSHEFIIDVTYADGETAVLQWSSWSYGIVACPILISMGSGPPGQLEIVP